MIVPFLVFWAIIFFARHELGWRGILIAVGVWAGLLLACLYSGLSSYIFVSAQALLDAILHLGHLQGRHPHSVNLAGPC